MGMAFHEETILKKIQNWMEKLKEQQDEGQDWSRADKELLSRIMFLGVPTEEIERNLTQTYMLFFAGISNQETTFLSDQLLEELKRRGVPHEQLVEVIKRAQR